jgi:hypothetical protein
LRVFTHRAAAARKQSFRQGRILFNFLLDTSPEFLAERLREWIPKSGRVEQGEGECFESYVYGNAQPPSPRLRRGRTSVIEGKWRFQGKMDLDETEKALSR